MWRTSEGDRILRSAERRLFIRGLRALVDWINDCEDWTVEVHVFDDLSKPEKLAILEHAASALLQEDVACPSLTAVSEGAVAAIYAQLKINVDLEIHVDDENTERGFVLRACEECNWHNDLPCLDSTDSQAWHDILENLSDRILWDRDWADALVGPDDHPDTAHEVREFADIDADYYTAVGPDPSPARLEQVRAKLARLSSEAD